MVMRLLILLASGLGTAYASAWNMPRGVTPISHEIFELHMIVFYICVAIALGVLVAMFWIMLKYRRSQGAKAVQFHHDTLTEVICTLIPTLILIVMAIPATRVLIAMHDTSKSEINIKVTGRQWFWEYSYLDEGIKFSSHLKTTQAQIHGKAPKGPHYLLEVDHPLVVPIHKKIRFLVTSTDVNHSWLVPEFAIKKDAIPGIVNTAWARIEQPGIYRGQCTELCGMHHGFMPIVVVAVPEKDYESWVKKNHQKGGDIPLPPPKIAKKKYSHTTLMKKGKKTYNTHCAVCHQADGTGNPPAYPSIKGSQIATGPVNAHIKQVLYGKRGTAMQAFGPQLSNKEIASVITYQRNSWGNQNKTLHGLFAGGLIQPQAIQAVRTHSKEST